MADDLDERDEIEEAKEDLRDALHEMNHRVGQEVARLGPSHGIRKHPLTTACIAGALGFALGAESAEVALIGLALLGGAFVVTNKRKVNSSREITRV
jgi:hypothetical protein